MGGNGIRVSTKLYEGMFLFDSNLAAKDWPGLERHVQDVLQKNTAELVYSERWPDRKLAYEIKGCKKGTYYLTYFKAPPQSIQPLTRDCELSERILRLLVLYDEDLAADCEKRISREVTGSPEEIEEKRERALRQAADLAAASAPTQSEREARAAASAAEEARTEPRLGARSEGPREIEETGGYL